MQQFLKIKNLVAAAAFVAICALAYVFAPETTAAGGIAPPWYSVLPPLIAITLAVATGRVVVSLGAGVLSALFMSTAWTKPTEGAENFGAGFIERFQFVFASVFNIDNSYILVFVFFVLSMVAVMVVAGGMQGIVKWLGKFAVGPRSTSVVTFLMGLAVFIDDYANTMIVGSSMRPVTDKHRISREKLAFIVDATSAPVAGLAIVSTWVGYEVGQFDAVSKDNNFGIDGFPILLEALPFRFYCILMIVFVLINAATRWDFGPMAEAERRARDEGDLAAKDAVPLTSKSFHNAEPDPKSRITALSAVIPIGVLLVSLIVSMWFNGAASLRAADESLSLSLLSWESWRDVLGEAESIKLLAYCGALGLAVAFGCALLLGSIGLQSAGRAVGSGLRSSILPVIILCLAWGLNATSSGLGTAYFLVELVGDKISPLAFPAIIFIIASMTAFATGTSYGTMAILIPVAGPIAFTSMDGGTFGPITAITLAAVLDGAILGDHCSPVSDTTVMSSIASSCDHMHHVRTQLPYSMMVGTLAIVCGYLPAAKGVPFIVSVPLAAACIVGLMYLFSRPSRARAAASAGAETAAP